MPVTRRFFLLAAPALAALPATVAPAPSVAEAIAAVAAPLRLPPKPWWGYTYKGSEFINRGGDSFEETIKVAIGDGCDGEVTIALCHPMTLSVPDFAEDIVDWLGSGFGDMTGPLSESFDGSNSDRDFEGEVQEANADADWDALAVKLMPILMATLERHGIFIPGEIEGSCLEDCDYALDTLAADKLFAAQVQAVADAWAEDEGLLHASMMVDTTDEKVVTIPARQWPRTPESSAAALSAAMTSSEPA